MVTPAKEWGIGDGGMTVGVGVMGKDGVDVGGVVCVAVERTLGVGAITVWTPTVGGAPAGLEVGVEEKEQPPDRITNKASKKINSRNRMERNTSPKRQWIASSRHHHGWSCLSSEFPLL
jgi:hypothetical protein